MNNKDFKKNFIENFKEQNNPNISFEDTFDKESTQNNNIYYNRYISLKKRHKLQAIFSCFLIILLIVGTSIVLINFHDNFGDNQNDYLLSEEEQAYILNTCNRVNEYPIIIIRYDGDKELLIYKGMLNKNSNECFNFYYYKMLDFDKPVKILYDDVEITIDNTNQFGFLSQTIVDTSFEFSLVYNETTRKYKIS